MVYYLWNPIGSRKEEADADHGAAPGGTKTLGAPRGADAAEELHASSKTDRLARSGGHPTPGDREPDRPRTGGRGDGRAANRDVRRYRPRTDRRADREWDDRRLEGPHRPRRPDRVCPEAARACLDPHPRVIHL